MFFSLFYQKLDVLTYCKRVLSICCFVSIFLGDHKQLPPMCYGKAWDVERTKADRSLLERVLDCSKSFPSQLTIQYRMHPRISDLVSKLFYEGTIITGLKNSERSRPNPLCWIDHKGYERDRGTSKVNEDEIIHVIRLYRQERCNKPEQSIIIMVKNNIFLF